MVEEIIVKEKTMLEQAIEAADRLEAANKKQEELLKKQEELMARQALGGRTFAGQVPEKPKEETPQEYANKLRQGLVNPLKK